jgi:hypothetical protein
MRKFITFLARDSGTRSKSSLSKENSQGSKYSSPLSLKAGDVVRVRSKEQILQTLDENNKLGKCNFSDGMWQYCGGEYKVLKRIEHFYDEASCRMLRTRDLVLLEGLHCSGNLPAFKHRCDKHCLYFWKEAWLEKIE